MVFWNKESDTQADEPSSSHPTNKNNKNDDNNKFSLLTGWNAAAAATVLLPLVLYGIASLVNRGDGDGGNEEGWWGGWWGGGGDGDNQGWWRWGNGGDAAEGQGRGALAFVYLWSVALFALLVWRGNRVLSNNKDDRALFAALVVFANLAFLCWILIAGLGMQQEGEAAERGWLSQFPAAVVLTFVCWTIFGAVFAAIMFGRMRKSNKSFFGNSDYQKYEDEGGII